MQALAPTIHEFSLPREPFLRLIEANRMDQRIAEYETWDDLKEYCRHSADPVGRLVLGLLRLDGEPELVAASDDVCTGLQLVNFLQDVPRDLELGRIYLPLEDRRRFGVTVLDRAEPELLELLRFEAARAGASSAGGRVLQERIGGRIGRAVGLFARGGLAALDALEAARWDVFTQRPRPSRHPARAWRRSHDDHGAGLRGGRAADARARAQLRVRDHGAAEGEAARDRRDLRVRARGRRHRRRRAAAGREAASGSSSYAPRSTCAGRRRDVGRARRRARAVSRSPPGAARLSSTAACRTSTSRATQLRRARGYCAKVAGAVGVACIAVYGADEPERAETLGIALQLINIMRDVREDWELGRVYLPQDELASFGVSEDDIAPAGSRERGVR